MLVRRYSHIEKNGSLFHPLRAAGLAVELAHKLARDVGFGAIDQKKLCSISIQVQYICLIVLVLWVQAEAVVVLLPLQDLPLKSSMPMKVQPKVKA